MILADNPRRLSQREGFGDSFFDISKESVDRKLKDTVRD